MTVSLGMHPARLDLPSGPARKFRHGSIRIRPLPAGTGAGLVGAGGGVEPPCSGGEPPCKDGLLPWMGPPFAGMLGVDVTGGDQLPSPAWPTQGPVKILTSTLTATAPPLPDSAWASSAAWHLSTAFPSRAWTIALST